jgi:hypothetical protein
MKLETWDLQKKVSANFRIVENDPIGYNIRLASNLKLGMANYLLTENGYECFSFWIDRPRVEACFCCVFYDNRWTQRWTFTSSTNNITLEGVTSYIKELGLSLNYPA